MNYCPKCGSTVSDDALFCMQCGTKLEIPAPRKRAPIVLIFALAAVIIVAVAILLLNLNSKPTLMPYNLQWGVSYAQVVEKDPTATEPKLNDGGNYSSNGSLPSNYLNLEGFDSITSNCIYVFDPNDALVSILIIVFTDGFSDSKYKSVFDSISNHYSEITGTSPESPVEIVLWDKFILEDTEISVNAATDSAIFVSLSVAENG